MWRRRCDGEAGGGLYAISLDRTGLQASTQHQRQDCLALSAKLEFVDPQVFIDKGISKFDGGRRSGYVALAAQLWSGATCILVWHDDRRYRRPRKLEDLTDQFK